MFSFPPLQPLRGNCLKNKNEGKVESNEEKGNRCAMSLCLRTAVISKKELKGIERKMEKTKSTRTPYNTRQDSPKIVKVKRDLSYYLLS